MNLSEEFARAREDELRRLSERQRLVRQAAAASRERAARRFAGAVLRAGARVRSWFAAAQMGPPPGPAERDCAGP
jgi:hypothetical protein